MNTQPESSETEGGRIKCPHCGAGNRDGSGSSSCWQCGDDLWAPVRRGTYALERLPSMGATQFLGHLPMPPGSAGIPRWKLVIAGLAALLMIVLFFAALFVYLDSRPIGTPASNASASPLR